MTPTPTKSVCARIGAFGWKHNVCPAQSRAQCSAARVRVRTKVGGLKVTAYFHRDTSLGVWAFTRHPNGCARVWWYWVSAELDQEYRGTARFMVDTDRTFVEIDNAKEYLRERIDAMWAGITAAAMACTD